MYRGGVRTAHYVTDEIKKYMKKYLFGILVALLAVAGASAQNWSAVLSSVNGLPGVEINLAEGSAYNFVSPVYTPGTATQVIRITVLDTKEHEQPNGNNYCFALSELAVYDGNGEKISYEASSNADHNTLSWWNIDGDGLSALNDDDYNTYFHSMWSSYYAVAESHYVELALSKPVSSFSLEWATRLDQPKNAPTKVAITFGTDYVTPGKEFELGNLVTTTAGLASSNALYVLKSNNTTSFVTESGDVYSGSGPVYMNSPEKGTLTATFDNVVQFIPSGSGYLVYWPAMGVFLKDSGDSYNGKNGWQYGTSEINEAAVVNFTPAKLGDFEMSYTSTYPVLNADDTKTTVTDILYVGADVRDNVSSKTKTFAPNKKTALDNGDYTQGYALPIAFNWSIYEAKLYASTVENVALSLPQIATSTLTPLIREANTYKKQYGITTGSIAASLDAAISAAQDVMSASAPTIEQINSAAATLSAATVEYVAIQIDVYTERIDSLLAASEFSSYPYEIGTYPESSRDLLGATKTTITNVKASLDNYTVAQLNGIYDQVEADINRFLATKITYSVLPLSYGAADGLPGVKEPYGGYTWETPIITLKKSVTGVRVTFNASTDASQQYAGYPMISLAEVELYDSYGDRMPLTEASFATNSQELSEGPLKDICDGDDKTYWHSIWDKGVMDPVGEVYLDINFPQPMQDFVIVLRGRDNGALFPAEITISDMAKETTGITGDAVYVYLSDGGLDVFAVSDIDGGYYTQGDYLCFPMKSGDVVYYTSQEYDSISSVVPELPELTSFKFNNKYNPTLFVDVEASVIEENIYLRSNAIGKWLTASFQLSDDKAVAYVGDVLQESKVTRQSFAAPVTYTVTYPGYNRVNGSVKVKDEEWETSEEIVTEMPLTSSMLSTNKPSTSESESVASLLDNDPNTIYHSTWGSANNATLNVNAYIEIDLPVRSDNLKLYYKCRPQIGYNPLVLEIYGCGSDGMWTLVHTLTTADGMPTGGVSQEYTSPVIPFDSEYTKVRVLQASGEYSKNHMALAEMRLYDVTINSTLVSDAVYETKREPYGRTYNVEIDWLTDNAVSAPRIDIDIEGGAEVVEKDKYLNATFRITGYGVYDNFEETVQIKGRGNTTWSYPKKPYRLKFASKVKPFGLTKGKSWALLANYQTGSMLANAAAMKIGQMAGAEYTNHMVPVELYINGRYRGSYMFTEKVGIANNSVDIDDELGYLLELDTYYDETYKFKTRKYRLPVNIKDPDLSEYTTEAASARRTLIENDFNTLDVALYNMADIDTIVDADAFASFMLANDLVMNQEIGHPKSTYLFKEELENPDSKIKFGPLWDFDWGFGYESTRDYATTSYTSSVFNSSMSSSAGYRFFSDMMNDRTVKKYYYKAWKEFLDNKSIEELVDYMESYYNFARTSFENNATVWGDGNGYAAICTRMNSWMSNRAQYLYSNLDVYDLDEFIYPLACDVDKSNTITVHDIAVTTAYLRGNTHSSFTYSKADTDTDGFITATDLANIENAIAVAEPIAPMQLYSTPVALGELYVNDFELMMNEDYTLPVCLSHYSGEGYKALQMDITVPDGVMIFDATGAGSLTDHKVVLSQRDMTTYRVLVYSNGDELFNSSEDAIVNLVLNSYMVVPEDSRSIKICNALVVDELTDELRLNEIAATFGVTTNIYDVAAPTASVTGGDAVVVTALVPQSISVYSVDGRLVRRVDVAAGTTRIELPAGIYIVNGTKVTIK